MTTDRSIQQAIAPLLREIVSLREDITTVKAFVEIAVSRHSDFSHLSIAEIARIRGISRATARRMFAGDLERIPGRKGDGVPIEKVFTPWLPLDVARRLVERLKAAA